MHSLALFLAIAGAFWTGFLGIVALPFTFQEDDPWLGIVLVLYPVLLGIAGIVGWFRRDLGILCAGGAVVCLILLFVPPLDLVDLDRPDGILQAAYGGPAILVLAVLVWTAVQERYSPAGS